MVKMSSFSLTEALPITISFKVFKLIGQRFSHVLSRFDIEDYVLLMLLSADKLPNGSEISERDDNGPGKISYDFWVPKELVKQNRNIEIIRKSMSHLISIITSAYPEDDLEERLQRLKKQILEDLLLTSEEYRFKDPITEAQYSLDGEKLKEQAHLEQLVGKPRHGLGDTE